MKRIITLTFFLLYIIRVNGQQTVIFDNPSFEGTPAPHQVPDPWESCYGSPDTQPGTWGVTQNPSFGNTYVSFLCGGQGPNDYLEGASQLLPQCLTAGQLYQFYIDVAFSPVYNTAEPGDCYGSLEVRGGNSLCDTGEVVWQSGMITTTGWNTYTISFVPAQNFCYLTFSPYWISSCTGYINCMIDNIRGTSGGGLVVITSPQNLSEQECGFLITGVTDTIADEVILNGNFIGSTLNATFTSDTTWQLYVSYPSGFLGNETINATAYFDNYNDTASAWITLTLDSCYSDHRLEITSPGNYAVQSCGFLITGLTDSIVNNVILEGNFTGSPVNAYLLSDTTWQQWLSYPYGFTGNDTIYATGYFPNDTLTDFVIVTIGNNTIPPQELCVVTVDSATDKNTLIWEKEITTAIDHYSILKETNQNNVYAEIGLVPYDSLSVFVDILSNPFQNANRYKIAIVDTCGLTSVEGTPHKTIHLSINLGLNNVINLAWNQYEGLPILTYNIYRGQTPELISLLASVPSNIVSFTDNFPIIGANYYYVEAVLPDSCTPFRDGVIGSLSNYTSQLISSITEYTADTFFTVYPNPNNGTFDLNFNSLNPGAVSVSLYDVPGQLIYQSGKLTNSGKHTINTGEIASGIYFLSLNTECGVFTKKIIVKR